MRLKEMGTAPRQGRVLAVHRDGSGGVAVEWSAELGAWVNVVDSSIEGEDDDYAGWVLLPKGWDLVLAVSCSWRRKLAARRLTPETE